MTPGNKRLLFEHAHNLKASLKQYNVNIFGDGSGRNFTTGRYIDKEVTDGVLHAHKTLQSKIKNWDQEEKEDFKVFISLTGRLSSLCFTW